MRSALKAFLLCTLFAFLLSGCNSASRTSQSTPPPTNQNPPPSNGSVDVVTYHNDIARTGQNLSEATLTTANVNSSSFGKIAVFSVDGKVDAEPLYLSALSVGEATHNVLFVVTEHDNVYAFDADSGTVLWKVSMLQSGETTSDTRSCSQVVPEIGITSTPVIQRSMGPHGTIYLVSMSKDNSGAYHQRLHALDVTTGSEQFGGPVAIQASFPGTGDNATAGKVVFDPAQYEERSGLLLLNGVIYTSWTSHCDNRPYTGWVISYDATTLVQKSVLNLTPNGNEGAIWMAGAGPAADSSGNIYVLDANGSFDSTLDTNGFPSQKDFGNAFLKLSTTSSQLAVADYFEMSNELQENDTDIDLGSGGAMVLPDLTDGTGNVKHLTIGAGKDANIYVVNRDNMGKFNANTNNIYQEIQGQLAGSVFSMPAYFNNTVYYGAVGDNIKAFPITNAQLASTPKSKSTHAFGYPGATPSISANQASNGIIWVTENSSPAVLHAYDATDLSKELYNSSQATGGRDNFGDGNKFITPMIANGKVFVGTTNGVGVFGLLH